jgi:hypothetical protein
VLVNESSPHTQEFDLGHKFEVVGLHCAGLLNQSKQKFGGAFPDAVTYSSVNCRWSLFKSGPCTYIPNSIFVEVKNTTGFLSGRALEQGRRMVNWLATNHQAHIRAGNLPSLIYITVADTQIPGSLTAVATSRRVRMAQYVVTYDTFPRDTVFCSLPVRPLNNIVSPSTGRRVKSHNFKPRLRCVPLSLMRLAMQETPHSP